VKELVFFLEEESAKVLLEILCPRLIDKNRVHTRFIVFEGKQDLQKQLERKLRGYLNPHASFIVLRDQDSGDCHKVKRSLKALCARAGRPNAIVRVACRELEAFYLGDLRAVELGLGIKGVAVKQDRAKYRDPDRLISPSRELEELTSRGYQKVAGSRAIGPHLQLVSPRSRSLHHLLEAIRNADYNLLTTHKKRHS
jgi:hypothetical protein